MAIKDVVPAGPSGDPRNIKVLHNKVVERLETNYNNFTLVTSFNDEKKYDGARGLARRAQDIHKRSMSTVLLMNCASNSKIITAVAVLKMLLKSSKVSLSTPMYKYLPKAWEVHPDVKKITFQNLLGYRSGLKEIKNTSGNNLKNLVCEKPFNVTGYFNYKNVDYALFRYLLPGLASYNYNGFLNDSEYGLKFKELIEELVFEPIDLTNVHVKMPSVLKKREMLSYSNWNTTTKGVGSNDQLKSMGSTGWFLTTRDYAHFCRSLWYTDKLLPQWLRDKMFDEGLAYDYTDTSAEIGFATKGGLSSGGKWAYRSRFVGFKNGVSMVVYANNGKRNGMEGADKIIKQEFKTWYETKMRIKINKPQPA